MTKHDMAVRVARGVQGIVPLKYELDLVADEMRQKLLVLQLTMDECVELLSTKTNTVEVDAFRLAMIDLVELANALDGGVL